MTWQVFVLFDGAERDLVEEFSDLGAAASFALTLADNAGRRNGQVGPPPKAVEIFRGDWLEISIQVLPGGL